jgi:mevalonate kinase
LTNSKIPRDTKRLVAGVGELKAQQPDMVNKLLNDIQSISDEARRALADPELPRKQLIDALSVNTHYILPNEVD